MYTRCTLDIHWGVTLDVHCTLDLCTEHWRYTRCTLYKGLYVHWDVHRTRLHTRYTLEVHQIYTVHWILNWIYTGGYTGCTLDLCNEHWRYTRYTLDWTQGLALRWTTVYQMCARCAPDVCTVYQMSTGLSKRCTWGTQWAVRWDDHRPEETETSTSMMFSVTLWTQIL